MANQLDNLRKKINKLDSEILEKLARRFSVVKKIGEYKNKFHLPIIDRKREKELAEERKRIARELELEEELVIELFKLITKKSRQKQKGDKKIIDNKF